MSNRFTQLSVAGLTVSLWALTAGVVAWADSPGSTPHTELVSAAMTGGTANGYADRQVISADGTKITFDSNATDMSSDPSTSKEREIFERDLASGVIRLVTVGVDGSPGNGFSSFSWPNADGSLVAFMSHATNLTNPATTRQSVFVRNMSSTQTIDGIPPQTTRLVSISSQGQPANGASNRPMLTPNAMFIAFNSTATNLTGAATNGQNQEYLRNLVTGTTTLISSAADGTPGNGLSYRGMVSSDGSVVAFASRATNLVPGDTNGREDIFVKNMASGAITRISNRSDGLQGGGTRPYMTPDGLWVVFNTVQGLLPSDANALTDVYVYNTQTGALTLGSPGIGGANGKGGSLRGFITNDGRYVVFNSFAGNLVAHDTNHQPDAFAFDTTTGTMTLLTLSSVGGPANGASYRPVPSADGSLITFSSQATNLVPGGSAPPPPTKWETFVVTLESLVPGGDIAAPFVAVTSPKAFSTVVSPVSITGTASDNVAVDYVSIAVKDVSVGNPNSGLWLQPDGTFAATVSDQPVTLSTPYGSSTSWSLALSLPDSKYNAQVSVADTAGNTLAPKPHVVFTVSSN